MYNKIGTKDLIPEISAMLIEKKHLHLSNKDIYNLIRLHHGLLNDVLRKNDGVYWFLKFKMIPNIDNIMRRKNKNKERQFNYLLTHKKHEHTDE